VNLAVPSFLSAQITPTTPQRPDQLELLLNSPNPTAVQDYLNVHSLLRIVGLLTLITLFPFILIMTTSFTRILVVFSFLRQALGTPQVPSGQIIIGLSLILTGFVMNPVIDKVFTEAINPYLNHQLDQLPEVKMGLKGSDTILIERVWGSMREFMLQHTREKDLSLFLELGRVQLPPLDPILNPEVEGTGSAYNLNAIPWYCLTPAFVLSELRIAFLMGFLLFVPFLVIDMVVSSILMSMGMMMLPPMMISTPFKLLLFILVDGWNLVMQQIVKGFYPMG
jgi:flagellar biosynthetic protein FliP